MTKILEKPIGIIKAEGSGPEVMNVALACLQALEKRQGMKFTFVEYHGPAPATQYSENAYQELKKFYQEIKARGGCILRAAIYARIVYQLRKDFDAICKPIFFEPILELLDSSLLSQSLVKNLNVLLIRENAQGLLFSEESVSGKKGERIFHGTFTYYEKKIKKLVEFAFLQASRRKKALHLFIKSDVWQKLAPLWLEAVEKVSAHYPEIKFDWDHADTGFADLLVHPTRYDVIVALGIAGDIISDPLSTLLYGSHAVVPSANISPDGFMTFQTVHGTAHAIAGQNKVNPIGMIRAAAMMLRLFFNLQPEATLLESAVRKALGKGYRTIDLYRVGDKEQSLVGTKEITERIVEEIRKQ